MKTNKDLKFLLNYILSDKKTTSFAVLRLFSHILSDKKITFLAVLLSTLFIYKLGKEVGGLVYYILN